MPYKALSELPDAVKKMPKHAQEIYMKAFNSAFEQHKGENGAEPRSHAIAWSAVKRKYKQVDGRWVAKESKEAAMVSKVKEAELSDENKRNLLQTALTDEYKLKVQSPIPSHVWIDDIFEDYLIYSIDGQLYKASYELAEDGTATFGDPEKVVAQKIYKPMESLQSTYSEIIQEAGRRNATLDSTRIRKILTLCQELLSDEEPDEKKTKEVLKEAESILAWVKEQAAMKTEDGVKFPAAAYAYVPDAEKSSTWKLRLWEDPDKKVTRTQLGRAAAALSPGGFRGQRVQIPSADLPAVKRKIRAEYRKLDVEDEDIPRWVKEVMTRERILNFTPLTEAKYEKRRATVVVIKPGFNADESRYYPAEMLKRDYKVFEGMKMYADHPTATAEKELSERSIRDWVATLKEVICDESGVVTGVAEVHSEWLNEMLASLRDKEMLSEMGISINAVGSASKATIDGKETLVIEKLVACRSVDFVTEPGAGGIVTFYESDRRYDIDLVELSTLKEKRPDLVKSIETEVRAEITREVKKAMGNEELIKERDEQIATLTKERDDLKEAAEKAEKDKAKAEAQATIKEAVDKAELPEAAKERLIERFKDAESANGIEEAITNMKEFITKLSEAGTVKGMGPTQASTEKSKEALRESFKKANPGWNEEQLETAVSGR